MNTIALFFLCLLAAIVPWEENFYISEFVSTARILGLLAFGLGVLKVLFSGRMRIPPLLLVWFALFIAWCLLAVNWSIIPEATLSKAITYVLLFSLVWLTWELADTPARQKWIMRAIVFGTAVLIFNVYLNFLGHGLSEQRATAESANPNGVATAACLGILFALFLITRREKGQFELPNWIYWGFIAAAGIVIPLTGSRAGLISAGLTSIAFFPMLRQSTRKSGWKNLLAILVIAAAILVTVPRLASRAVLQRLIEGRESSTFRERVSAWDRGFQALWSKNPLLGVGPGTYAHAGLGLREVGRAAHNTYVSVFVETGFVGIALFLAFWLLLLRRILLMPKNDRFFWLVFLVSVQPTLLTASGEYYKFIWLIGALILCQSANPKPVNRRPLVRPVRMLDPVLRPPAPSGS
jgi:O-antigen ligase